MSGAYIIRKTGQEDFHRLAHRISSAMSFGAEQINHYCVRNQTVMGLVGNDKFRKGIMPVYVTGENLWVVLLGELHECGALSAFRRDNPDVGNDAGVFARLFRKGTLAETLPGLNGAFFVILFDPDSDTIIAANDRYGLYPMYYSHSDKGFCIGSRVLCSVISRVVEGDWDPAGVAQFLTIDDFLGDTTLVSGVKAFPQASVMVLDRNGLTARNYWSYQYRPGDLCRDEEGLAEELGRRFLAAVKRQAGSAGRIGVTLSGGLDSRSLVAAASRAGIGIRTFTWGKPGSYDRKFSRGVSQLFGTDHHDCDYAYHNIQALYEDGIRITEGLINYFDCHMLFHLHILKTRADIILNGYAGDLLLGGSYLRKAWMSPLPPHTLAEILFQWRNTLVPEQDLSCAMPDVSLPAREAYPSNLYRTGISRMGKDLATPDVVDRFFLENRVRRSTAMGTVLMREVVESAACFFEYDLLDLITSIPYGLRQEHRIYRGMMRHAFPEAMRVRWQRTLLPVYVPSALDLPAKAFLKGCRIMENTLGWPEIGSRQSPVDFASLLRGMLRPWMEGVIGEPHPGADSVLRQSFCSEVWKSHLAGEDRTRVLGVIAGIRGLSDLMARTSAGSLQERTRPTEVSSY